MSAVAGSTEARTGCTVIDSRSLLVTRSLHVICSHTYARVNTKYHKSFDRYGDFSLASESREER